jgi:hypothetical protein
MESENLDQYTQLLDEFNIWPPRCEKNLEVIHNVRFPDRLVCPFCKKNNPTIINFSRTSIQPSSLGTRTQSLSLDTRTQPTRQQSMPMAPPASYTNPYRSRTVTTPSSSLDTRTQQQSQPLEPTSSILNTYRNRTEVTAGKQGLLSYGKKQNIEQAISLSSWRCRVALYMCTVEKTNLGSYKVKDIEILGKNIYFLFVRLILI